MSAAAIRPATVDDAELLAEMAAALSAAEGQPPPRFDAATCRRDGFGPVPRFAALIAEIDGRPAGYALHHCSYDTDRLVRAAWLADLYVESWARGRGIGYRLARQAALDAAAEGAAAMHWCVLRDNQAARRFYRRFAGEDERLRHCHLEGEQLRRLAIAAPRSAAAIRPAVATDAPSLAAMLDGLMAALGEPSAEVDTAWRLLADGFGPRPSFAALIAEGAGEAEGYALYWPIYDTNLGGEVLFLSDLYVVERARGGGLARDLMAAVARDAEATGFGHVFWEVLEGNARARAFYRRIARESDGEVVVTCAGADFRRLIAS
jgi:GNAT superfamily N-acetyltransferase